MAYLPKWVLAGALAIATLNATPSYAEPVSAAVDAAYDKFHIRPIWFRSSVSDPAITQLIAILERAPFDGVSEGPELAAQVQATAGQANSADPSSIAAADRVLSAAWVQYVRALKRPTPGMIYAYPVLQPQGTGTEEILLTAAAAPSLERYLVATSDLNPIYAQLRDVGWAEAQATGNMTPDPRLLANLDRARSIPATGRFMIVDSGDQRLTLYENGEAVDSMKVIVGTSELPTPLISSIMYYVTYNPYWHAPDHLVRKTIAPNVLRLGLKYFTTRGYHVIDDWSEDARTIDPSTIDWKAAAAGTLHLRIRQDPGRWNSMGNLKFPFANPQDIYLHDTPGKELFAKDQRHLSNGCVRVEDAPRLARWLLGTDPVAPGSDPETPVQVPHGVPIILTYLTAKVQDGKISYLPDIYGWDSSSTKQIAAAQ
ncbi:MAG TPA: L,D-transpeptidase family protein [Sphingomicrobium sp.]|nr:L,D-transpeptidase family protein [Sphingomicrobium sp.]